MLELKPNCDYCVKHGSLKEKCAFLNHFNNVSYKRILTWFTFSVGENLLPECLQSCWTYSAKKKHLKNIQIEIF